MIISDFELRLNQQRETINREFAHKEEWARRSNKQIIYPNQREAAVKCVTAFCEGKTHVCLVAQPGTGKTGTALEVMRLLGTHPDNNHCVDIKDMYISCGMSDKDWEEQFKRNMLPCFVQNVIHRGNLLKNTDKIAELENGFLLTDECHIASGKNMTGSKMLKGAGLTDYATVKDRQMKMLDISATPETVSHDLQSEEWKDKSYIAKLLPGPTYKGFQSMTDDGRIIVAPILDSREKAFDLLNTWNERYAGTTKKYFPIRVSYKMDMENIYHAATMLGWKHTTHNSETRISEIDEIMEHAPSHHTIIFVKGFWRASKRIVRKHVGGTYEMVPKKRNTTATAQSLAARFCDNYEYSGDELNIDLRPTHYTDLHAIEEYLNWFNNDCDYTLANYTSARIKSKGGEVDAKPSKMHPSNYRNLLSEGQVVSQRGKKRVPYIINIPAEEQDYILANFNGTTLSKEQKTEVVRRIVAPLTLPTEFKDIIAAIVGFQFSVPNTDSSYEKNITAYIKAYNNNEKKAIKDAPDEIKGTTCWQCFIDNRTHKLCVLWQVIR